MDFRSTIALSGLAILLPVCQAQMRGSIAGSGAVSSGASFGPALGAGAGQRFGARHFSRSEVVLGTPYFYADYPYPPAAVPPPQPQVIVVQVPTAAAEAPPEPRVEPLLIEWQGDRYVRLSGRSGASEAGTQAQSDYASVPAAKPSSAAKPAANSQALSELRPVVLVYRDGHREEVRDYTIADGTIYAQGNYWADGFWTKQIKLAALDLPATMKASHAGGANFVLPAFPNEVVVRP